MARRESDREDLLREATALVERIELETAEFAEPIVVGFRRNGSGAIYFGADPVVQFNGLGELRRGYRAGRLLKADHGRLVELQRERTVAATTLVSRPLSTAEQLAVLDEFGRAIDRLSAALEAPRFRVVGQVPPESDVLGRVRGWLATLARPLPVATVPNA